MMATSEENILDSLTRRKLLSLCRTPYIRYCSFFLYFLQDLSLRRAAVPAKSISQIRSSVKHEKMTAISPFSPIFYSR